MSRENVEIVRKAIDAFVDRDLDAAVRDNDSDVEVDFSRSQGIEAGIYRDVRPCAPSGAGSSTCSTELALPWMSSSSVANTSLCQTERASTAGKASRSRRRACTS
jgi:hypothetical protein